MTVMNIQSLVAPGIRVDFCLQFSITDWKYETSCCRSSFHVNVLIDVWNSYQWYWVMFRIEGEAWSSPRKEKTTMGCDLDSYPYWSYPRCVINHTLLLCILISLRINIQDFCSLVRRPYPACLTFHGLRGTSPSISLENICHNRFF